jgi:hypothetical protein
LKIMTSRGWRTLQHFRAGLRLVSREFDVCHLCLSPTAVIDFVTIGTRRAFTL